MVPENILMETWHNLICTEIYKQHTRPKSPKPVQTESSWGWSLLSEMRIAGSVKGVMTERGKLYLSKFGWGGVVVIGSSSLVVGGTPRKYGGWGREECEKAHSFQKQLDVKYQKALRKDTGQEQEAPHRKHIISELKA